MKRKAECCCDSYHCASIFSICIFFNWLQYYCYLAWHTLSWLQTAVDHFYVVQFLSSSIPHSSSIPIQLELVLNFYRTLLTIWTIIQSSHYCYPQNICSKTLPSIALAWTFFFDDPEGVMHFPHGWAKGKTAKKARWTRRAHCSIPTCKVPHYLYDLNQLKLISFSCHMQCPSYGT